MNANEMADLMTGCPVKSYKQGDITLDFHEIATMLRHQQAEIEELKTCLIVEQEHNERIEAILRKAQLS